MNDGISLVGGGLLLYFGAEWFVGGASALALALRVPQLLVGLTIVAYGTSAPEIIVGVQAASVGHGGVALGNVIGSNIANVGLILGIATLIRPVPVDGSLRRRELPVLAASGAIMPVLLLDGVLTRWEAAGLLLVAVAYTGWMVHTARSSASVADAKLDAKVAVEAVTSAGSPKLVGVWRAVVTAAVGLTVLFIGGSLFVDSAVSVARALGMTDRLMGLTVVALGTSLPELITSIIAAHRGHSDLAVGTVVGSNIFNTFLCLGVAGLAGSVAAPFHALGIDLVALVGMTALAVVFLRSDRTISRLEGAIALACYGLFIGVAMGRD